MIIKFKVRGVDVEVDFNENLYTPEHVKKYYRAAKDIFEFEELSAEWECVNADEGEPLLFPDDYFMSVDELEEKYENE